MPSVSLPSIAAVASAGGALFGGIAQGANASYQAHVAAMNAQIANQNSERAIQAGQAKVYAVGQKNAAEAGQTKAALAANGVDVNTGSALDVQTGQREAGQLDAQTAMNNAELEAYGYKTQAAGFQAQQGLDNAQAIEAPIGGTLNAAGSLLSSSTSISNKWTSGFGNSPSFGLPTTQYNY